jgi:ribonuclease P protein component
MGRLSFPRQARLRLQREFRRVYRCGRLHRVRPLRAHALARPEGRSRLGLAIGRKTGGAVLRNRWKRAIREAFRLQRHLLRTPHDLVVSVCWDAGPSEVARVGESFRRLVERLNAAGRGAEDGDGDP